MRYMLIHVADPDLASEWDDEAQAALSSWLEETISAYEEAAALAGTGPERRFLNARLAEVRSQLT